MDKASLEELLRRLGFSAKEVDTYLSILQLGEAKASTIADESGVSKRYVYSIAERLSDRGFVEVNDHVVPTTIRAHRPEHVVNVLTDDLEQMQPALDALYSQSAPQTEQFEVIKSRVTVLKRISKLLDHADAEVTLSLPHRLLDDVERELEAALDRDVLVLLLVTGVGPGSSIDHEGLASVTRAWNQPMPTMLTIDQATGLVAPQKMFSRSNSSDRAIVFNQKQLGPVIVGSFLGNYFPMATETSVTEPTALPTTFQSFRHAVLDASLHLRNDSAVRARIEGYDLQNGNAPIELEGTLVSVNQSLVEPHTGSFPVECSMVIETGTQTYTVGGSGAFIEDVEATVVELQPAETPR